MKLKEKILTTASVFIAGILLGLLFCTFFAEENAVVHLLLRIFLFAQCTISIALAFVKREPEKNQ